VRNAQPVPLHEAARSGLRWTPSRLRPAGAHPALENSPCYFRHTFEPP